MRSQPVAPPLTDDLIWSEGCHGWYIAWCTIPRDKEWHCHTGCVPRPKCAVQFIFSPISKWIFFRSVTIWCRHYIPAECCGHTILSDRDDSTLKGIRKSQWTSSHFVFLCVRTFFNFDPFSLVDFSVSSWPKKCNWCQRPFLCGCSNRVIMGRQLTN